VIVGNTVTGVTQYGAALMVTGAGGGTVVEGNVLTDNGGMRAPVYLQVSGTPVVFRGNLVVGNRWSFFGGVFTNGAVLNNVIWGGPDSSYVENAALQVQATGGPVINNVIGAGPQAGLIFTGSGPCPADVVNNIVHGAGTYGVRADASSSCDPSPRNNLFFNNAGGDYRDKTGAVWTGAVAINSFVPGAALNVDGDPLLGAGPSGTWTAAGVFNAARYQTTLTDSAAAFTPDALVGQILNPDTAQDRLRYVIEANTATTITVAGNATALGGTGASYEVTDFHLQAASPASDAGSSTVTGLPAQDIDGDPRPGTDGQVNIGADEEDTAGPVLMVTSPKGGEKLFSGSPYLIRWEASDTAPISFFDVFFSVDGGTTFGAVPGCSAVTGTARNCNWASPGPLSTQGRIRVVAEDIWGNSSIDESDSSFSIVTGAPFITVTSPNTAVTWPVGISRQIKWKHNLGTNSYVRIEVSRDAGVSWSIISASFKNTGATSSTFDWIVTDPTTSQGRIRVTWTANSAVTDLSNVNFNIVMPAVTVVTPNTAVNWGEGTTRELKWTHNLGSGTSVKIELSRDGGLTYPVLVCASCPSGSTSGTYNWTVPAGVTNSARIRVSWTASAAVSDASNVNFKISTPFVSMTAPTPSTSWNVGSARQIKWKHNLGKTASVVIELSRDAGATWSTLAASFQNSGETSSVFNWTVTGPATPTARMRVTWTSSATTTDTRAFVISP
jgi:hypothetical protein